MPQPDAGLQLVKGKITRYLDGPNRCYGFIDTEDGHQGVFFHNTRQKHVQDDGGETPAIRDFWQIPAVSGEEVFVKMEDGPKGKRAVWWMKARLWAEAEKSIESRKVVRMIYRQGRKPLSRLQAAEVTYTKEWEGKNLRQLRLAFNPVYYPCFDIEFSARYFQELQDDGTWVDITDPR